MRREPYVDFLIFGFLLAAIVACWLLHLPQWVLWLLSIVLAVQVVAWVGNRDMFRRGFKRRE